jgi:predicted MPP superfamily phosphohydrolase
MRVLFTSDTHLLGAWKSLALERLKALWIALSPDVMVVPGDIWDSSEVDESLKLLRRISGLATPIAVCLGNHDLRADS